MIEVSNEELKQVEGGIGVWIAAGITALVIFIAGIVDGFVRPLECHGKEN